MVNDAINYCYPLLAQYTKAFPSYTLHNDAHQKNILNLVSSLLDNKVKELTALETTFIILSTFFHDIGMVFSSDELASIEKEESFQIFIKEKYEARLIFEQNQSKINEALAEWYCRWMHAKRVWLYLDQFEKGGTKLEWNKISIKKELGYICESHNDGASNLLNEKYETDFLHDNDLRFCAILLRLADILDFDNSRTPKSVYEYLKLDKAETALGKTSKIEWEKHLASRGFLINKAQDAVSLKFTAAPQHPQVEKNIEDFLDVIEDELRRCQPVIKACSERWRDFFINPDIDRKNIRSQGYKKGNYQLSLDEKQIITLLTGENLYNSPFEFIRELLQNAIDTSRMREFHEHSNGNKEFKADPIQVTSWTDAEGYRWLRVDDFGMGMNEAVITNHLLKKGQSYYKSGHFKLQKLLYEKQTGRSFTPISRFGIGLLSCLILGDKIEITTRSIKSEQSQNKEEKIRLSIDGVQNQYILQTEEDKHTPLPFPQNVVKNQQEYRSAIGTSIAVRINRAKDRLNFEDTFKQTIDHYVTCSPIQVFYNGDQIGVDFDVLTQPIAKDNFYNFSQEQKQRIEELFDEKIEDECGIEIIAIDITRESAIENLKGQVIFAKLILELPENVSCDFEGDLTHGRPSLKIIKSIKEETTGKSIEKSIHLDLTAATGEALDICEPFLLHNDVGEKSYINSNINLIHNGINVPNIDDRHRSSETQFGFKGNIFTSAKHYYQTGHLCYGIIYLQDELIPNLSVSRNSIKTIGFSIYSSLYYATRRLNAHIKSDFFDYLDSEYREIYNHKIIADDYLVKNGHWDSINIIQKDGKPKSIVDLRDEVTKGTVKIYLHSYRPTFLSQLTHALLEINFDVVYDFSNIKMPEFSLQTKTVENNMNDEHASLRFLPFEGTDIISYNNHINTNHSLAKWLIVNQTQLKEEFSGYYHSLIGSLMAGRIEQVNKILSFFRQTIPETNVPPNISQDDYLKDNNEPPF